MMMNKFSEKYRPRDRSMLIGQSQLAAYDALMDGKVKQTLLFTGPSGSGKTSLAKMYAAHLLDTTVDQLNKNFNFHHLNSREIGIKYFTDEHGEFKQSLNSPSIWGGYAIFLFDEVEGLKQSSEQTVLLTMLENLPEHVIVMFCTLNPHELRKDLLSRFQKINLSVPAMSERRQHMLKILALEGVQVEGQTVKNATKTITREQANAVYQDSQGNIRTLMDNIESLLDGYFVPTIADEAEKDDFVKSMFTGKLTLSEAFTLAKSIDNYNSTVHGLCGYAIAILSNNSDSRKSELASGILSTFGQGLNSNISEKVAFYWLLLELYKNL